jgi:ribonucleoside-diphosphate reductase alpha chain
MKAYLTVGLYPNGEPGEIFMRMAKGGSTIAGLMGTSAQLVR